MGADDAVESRDSSAAALDPTRGDDARAELAVDADIDAAALSRPARPALSGLSSVEAASRAAAGKANVDTSQQRTDLDVVRSNTLTFFNVILGSLIVALVAVGEIRDGLFVGTVVIANVAIATLQELQATRRLRALRALTVTRATVVRDGRERSIPAEEVVEDDLLHLVPGDQVVADGHIVSQTAEIDESLLTGESEPVRRGQADQLRSGSFCVAGDCYYLAERVGIEAYVVKLTADARELVRAATPLTFRFRRVLRVLLIATAALSAALFIQFNVEQRGVGESLKATTATVTTVVPVGLLLGMTVVTAVGALRVSRSGAIVQDLQAVEALNYVDVVGLDKTGTLTTNRLTLTEIRWRPGMELFEPWFGAFADATKADNKTAAAIAEGVAARSNSARVVDEVPFSSARRWSAVELELSGERTVLVLGAPETVLTGSTEGARELREAYRAASSRGLRGVVLARASTLPSPDAPLRELEPLALVTLGDELRDEVASAFSLMDELGIEPKVISGDNPHTVAALLSQLEITRRGGVVSGEDLEPLDDEDFAAAVDSNTVFGRVGPQTKARIVEALKERGHFVAMVGDGANDVRALRSADVAVAMASGTASARGVAGIVLLDDSFAALIDGVQQATFVLGNTARLSKLFLAKSVYAFVLILATNMLGLDFPFLPRQGSIMSLLTLGIPAVFISIGVPPRNSERDFTRNVLRFALPAGLALAASAIFVQFLFEGLLSRDVEEARTLVSLTIVITGLAFVIEVLGLEGADWRRPLRPVLTVLLAGVLLALLLVTVTQESLRDFFEFTPVSGLGWTVVVLAVAGALAGQYIFSRHWQEIVRRIVDIATAKPSADEQPRGRSI